MLIALCGILLRLLLMPVTMHGQDLIFINYFPMMFVEEGCWNPYAFIEERFPAFKFTYYGPGLLWIMSFFNFIFVKIMNNQSYAEMLKAAAGMMGGIYTTIDYVKALKGYNLAWNLFLMKLPYLTADLLTGFIILRMQGDEKKAVMSFGLWMFNVVVIHSAYMLGSFDLIMACVIMLALYAAKLKRPFVSMLFLSLGGAIKFVPYFLIPPVCILLGNTLKKKAALLGAAGVMSLAIYLPYLLNSPEAMKRYFFLYKAVETGSFIQGMLVFAFFVLYLILCITAYRDSKRTGIEGRLVFYFSACLFALYLSFPIRFRYFVSITPLLALIMPYSRKFRNFIFILVGLLAFQWLYAREMQLGLFAPLGPDTFSGIPSLHEIMNRFVDIDIAHKVLARIFPFCYIVSFFWMLGLMRDVTVKGSDKV